MKLELKKLLKIQELNKIDSRGIATIEILFLIFIIIFLSISILGLFQSEIDSINNYDQDITARLLLENVSAHFNQVNQGYPSFATNLSLPPTINGNNYFITIDNSNLILEFNNKKGRETIFPINLVNSNGNQITNKKLFGGNSYLIKKLYIENVTCIMIIDI
jgi:hypothetical protein